MRRPLSIAAIFLTGVALPSQAQFTIGVRAGVASTDFHATGG